MTTFYLCLRHRRSTSSTMSKITSKMSQSCREMKFGANYLGSGRTLIFCPSLLYVVVYNHRDSQVVQVLTRPIALAPNDVGWRVHLFYQSPNILRVNDILYSVSVSC